jgi:hypothetical protein
LTGWDEAGTAALLAHAVGNAPGTLAVRDINDYNAQAVAKREAFTDEQNISEWERARQQLKAALQAVPAEKQNGPLVFPWGPSGTVAELIAGLAEHEAEHAQEIQALKARSPRPA